MVVWLSMRLPYQVDEDAEISDEEIIPDESSKESQ
jgi:hypothetical protein